MTPMRAIYDSSPSPGMTWEQFCACFGACEFLPVMDGDEVVGGVMLRGNEVHVGILRTPRTGVRRLMRHVIKQMMARNGEIIAIVPMRCAAYAERLKNFGFLEVVRTESKIELTLQEIPSWVLKQ